jgi:mono/diheme cytochrome c family protein
MSRLTPALLVLPLLSAVTRAEPPPVAVQARAVLATHCAGCHTAAKAKGGFGYVLDRERLVARRKIVPGKSAESELYERVHGGEMPPAGTRQRPPEADVAVLKRWIEAGAPDWRTAAPRSFVGDEAVLALALEDLDSVPSRQRRFMRYVTFAHLANAGAADADLRAHGHALTKLLNSLSWHPRLTAPEPIDAGHTVFRIDLRNYKWTARSWEKLVAVYPYRPPSAAPDAQTLAAKTESDLLLLRGDWFIAVASRPPLYHDLLGLPERDKALERLVGVEVLADQQDETAARAGFNGSGVSRNNRVIERHDANYGAYWRTYDFAENTERRNVFDHPLGPTAGGGSFVPDGGEIIFHLPNGLHGYMLVDGSGRRIDRAPVAIVSDPKRPDRVVENGLSCMSCHVKGVIPKADQVRGHVLKNRRSFAEADVAAVRALYLTQATLKVRFDEDAERFTKALAKLGVPAEEPEPVSAVALRYEGTLDLPAMASEVGMEAQEFARRLDRSPALGRLVGPLKVKGGTVQRSVVEASFAEIAREVRRPSSASGKALVGPFAADTGPIIALAFSADGRQALAGSEDGALLLWDVSTGKMIRRFGRNIDRPLSASDLLHLGVIVGPEPPNKIAGPGPLNDVSAAALSADGKRVATGGRDRAVRLWDVESGEELWRSAEHAGPVRCLAFSPDGKTLLSGSEDATLRLWDVKDGHVIRGFKGHAGAVTAVAYSPGGALAVSGSHDRTVRLWAVQFGNEVRKFEGHTREVYAVAFSSDGTRLLSGGNDRTVRLWDMEQGQELRRLDGHANAVIRVGFSADGKQVLSGSSQYRSADKVIHVWDADSGKELRTFTPAEREEVWCIAFSPDGAHALSGSAAKSLHLWKLK